MKQILKRKVILLLMACAMAGAACTGCKDNGNKGTQPPTEETQKTLAEQLVGKWNFSKSYEKKNGEWVEISFGLPDEGWHEYRADGTYAAYSRSGDKEHKVEMKWSVDKATNELQWIKDGKTTTLKVKIEADNTLSMFYDTNFDPATGQMIKGEFKDVLIRE